ncbi:pilin [Veronia pacifica]|uniref:Prepilin-type N-terminal cleavage/methylation domain-containing protein n=1 Tax=Veronia pacifica TaxID=1080227 RepID=A0A1C3ELH6_9GAMM|nr:pilin [Veronia pacifica]ODA34075.1 prepilin-type N-terminal cleavage/methylation domain-containing protein [Veronia pacifica]
MKKQQGFSLVELMIVVAVIGVLSAIAIPQYQNYVAKSQAAAALSTMSGLKTNIENSIAENSVFPTLPATAAGDTTNGVPVLTTGTLALAPTAEGSVGGTMVYAFNNTTQLNTFTLTLTRGVNGAWACSSSAANALVPRECR